MERLLRRYFWAFNLAFLALAMLVLARTANLFVESAIAPSPKADFSSSLSRSHKPQEALVSLDVESLARLLGLPVPAPEPEVTEPGRAGSAASAALDPNAKPVKSDLRVRLLGTLLAGSDEWTLASIQDLTTQGQADYRIGDRVLGAEVLDIERARVIVFNNGRREYIANDPNDPLPLAAPVLAAAPTGQALGAGVKSTGENSYEVPRGEIDRALADMNQLAMSARIVPAFKDGQAQGFKLFSIRPDSFYSKLGIINGDVIKRINGFELNSPEKGLEIYSKLKEANRIDIELDRNGSSIRKQYTVQ